MSYKKSFLIILSCLTYLSTFAQIKFEKGFFINNQNEKIECWIKDTGWKNNPTEFTYKLSEGGTPKAIDINTVKEFGIPPSINYKRFTTKIDRPETFSGDNMPSKDPDWFEETLFLKTIITGQASLYMYREEKLLKYFYTYNNDDSTIEQLIYRAFLIDNQMKKFNMEYYSQLEHNLKCDGISFFMIRNTEYELKDLTNFFIRYNECVDAPYTLLEVKKKLEHKLSIKVHAAFSNLSITTPDENGVAGLDNARLSPFSHFKLGVEWEVFFPFSKKKWAFCLEPTLQRVSSNQTITNSSTGDNLLIDLAYNSIEVPIGLKYYFFLNDNSKLFLKGAIAANIIGNENIISIGQSRYGVDPKTKFSFTGGFDFKDRLSFEVRFQTPQKIIASLIGDQDQAKFHTISLGVGYNLLRTKN